MDVTALLNTASAVHREVPARGETADLMNQTLGMTNDDDGARSSSSIHTSPSEGSPLRRVSESKAPNRSRTPWDANGYALPLTVDIKSAPAPGPVRSVFCSESPVESVSPNSPRHKCSDSHSSLSSYASSSSSLSHSRISSMSTAGGMPTMSIIPDVSSLELGPDCPDSVKEYSQRLKRDGVISPVAIIEETPIHGSGRLGSPSDAILISKPLKSIDQVSSHDAISNKEARSNFSFLIPPDPDLAKTHKRTVSAPNFAAVKSLDQTLFPPPSTLQPTTPTSHLNHRVPSYIMESPSVHSPATSGPSSQDDGDIRCMYVDNCDTGSTLRKAISHIFGRNKLCTRMIPQHVWVHFCRKHYQRSRYRNAQEYAKLQCDLVQKQVRRVQAWSDENKRNGQIGVVQDWSLSMRKREQNRVQDKSKKRPYRDESDDDENALDRAVLNGTAVPEWLRNKCRDGYSTDEIESIVLRLKEEMEENHLVQIPDIEILPNLSTDGAEEAKSKIPIKRKTGNGPLHKRSQSVGVALRAESSSSMIRRPSQPSYWQRGSPPNFSSADKRQRTVDMTSYCERPNLSGLHGTIDHSASGSGSAMRQMNHLPYRLTFNQIPQIQESRAEDSYNNIEDVRGPHYGYSGGPLPAPTPQRMTSTPMMAQLESNASGTGRPTHHRSVSEFGRFPQHPQFTFQMEGSSNQTSFTPTYNHSGPPSTHNQHSIHTQSVSQPQNSNEWLSPNYYNPSSSLGQRHSRHQSTPNVALSPIPRGPAPTYNQIQDPYHLNIHYGASSALGHPPSAVSHQLHYSSGQPGLYSPRPPYQESEQTKALYSERR
ncbi:hypothetical protein HD806DRAFT_532889 [Xylariaceae sp. AK1471]|nr:hypothetical protein HD806DRAFT_532889 [Xylariaceae sp. AK1471]